MLWRALAYGRAIGPTCRIPVRGDRPGRRRVGDDSVRSGALVAITPRRTAERWAGGRRWKWNQKRPGAKQAPLYCGGGAGGSAACRPNGSAPKPKQAEVGWGHCGAMSRGDRRGRRAGEKGRMGRSARQIERGTRMGSAPQGHNMPVCVWPLWGDVAWRRARWAIATAAAGKSRRGANFLAGLQPDAASFIDKGALI